MPKSWLFQVPEDVLREILRRAHDSGQPYTRGEAALSYMLDQKNATLKGERAYSRIWRWTRHRTRSELPKIKQDVGSWTTFYGAGGAVTQDEMQLTLEAQMGVDHSPTTSQPKIGTNGVENKDSRPAPDHSSTTTTRDVENKKKKKMSRRQIKYEEVMESWNAFASEVGLPTIRVMTDRRKAQVRARHDKVMPHLDTLYDKIRRSAFLRGKNDRRWTASFDFIWSDSYAHVLEGKYDELKPTPGSRQALFSHSEALAYCHKNAVRFDAAFRKSDTPHGERFLELRT